VKRWVAVALLLVVFATTLWGQAGAQAARPGSRTPLRATGPEHALGVTFVQVPRGAPVRDIGAGQGALDLGPVSYMAGTAREGITVTRRPRSFLISTSFGLRVGNEPSGGTAQLLGLVTHLNAGTRIAVDGISLSLTPQVLQVAIPFGEVSRHRLDVEIPVDAPETVSQTLNAIAFQVISN